MAGAWWVHGACMGAASREREDGDMRARWRHIAVTCIAGTWQAHGRHAAGTWPEEKVRSTASCPSRATLRSVPSTSTVTSAAWERRGAGCTLHSPPTYTHPHPPTHTHTCTCTCTCTCTYIFGGLGERGGGCDPRGVCARDGGKREGGGHCEAAAGGDGVDHVGEDAAARVAAVVAGHLVVVG